MILVWMACFATVAELLGMLWINRKETELALKLKKYGTLMVLANLALAVVAWYRESQGELIGWWYFGLLTYLFCLSLYDLKFRELPDCWHLLLLVFYGAGWLLKQPPVALPESLLVTVVLAAVLGLIFLLRREAIGMGDIKLLLVCGMYAGGSCAGFLLRGLILAFFFSIGLLLLKKATAKSELPFVPFLLAGALLI